jgi:DNA-binding NarL/FixJ family response regulator
MPAIPAREKTHHDGALLIVARAGTWRDSLITLLRTMPGVCVLDPLVDCSALLQAVPERQPAVVLADINVLDDPPSTLLRELRTYRPSSRCLLFVESYRRKEEARDSGADAVLLKGFSTPELFDTVRDLLTLTDRSSPRDQGTAVRVT